MSAVTGKRGGVQQQLSDFCSPRKTESALSALVVKRQQASQLLGEPGNRATFEALGACLSKLVAHRSLL